MLGGCEVRSYAITTSLLHEVALYQKSRMSQELFAHAP